MAQVFAQPIATKPETRQGFLPAEGYHEDFMVRNPDYPYIVVNDKPKVDALISAAARWEWLPQGR